MDWWLWQSRRSRCQEMQNNKRGIALREVVTSDNGSARFPSDHNNYYIYLEEERPLGEINPHLL